MPGLPDGWSPTADLNWGPVDENHFRQYMQLLIETYIDGGNPGEACSVLEFALFISERKGWDDAYRWIYKERTPEEREEQIRYWLERNRAIPEADPSARQLPAHIWKGGTGGLPPSVRLAPAEPYTPPEPVTRVDLTKTDPARTDPGGDGASPPR